MFEVENSKMQMELFALKLQVLKNSQNKRVESLDCEKALELNMIIDFFDITSQPFHQIEPLGYIPF